MRVLAVALVLFLGGCAGFHPVYGVNKYTKVGAEEKLAQVAIANIPDREGQYLRNALITVFYRDGRPVSPRYNLSVDRVYESTRDLDVTIDADSTRGQLRLSTGIVLSDAQTGQTLMERSLRSIASYNILASEFTNRVSEQNTRENALDDLARQIEEQLALYFKKQQ